MNHTNKLINNDCLIELPKLEENTIHVVLTDPPYYLDKLDNNWNPTNLTNQTKNQAVTSLPSGMKFDKSQGKKLYTWYLDVSKEIFRILKPGGFFISFSSPRLYHRMACAVEDAGFEIRDCFLWLYTQNQVKAMSLNHFIDKMCISEVDKQALKQKFKNWKTPQIKSCFEPLIIAQKPLNTTYLDNMIENNVGLLNTSIKVGQNMYPANILTITNISQIIDKYFLIPKPTVEEKGEFNTHKTVKPLSLCLHLLRLTCFANSVVLDPFMGSGTTILAAEILGLNYIGIDSNKQYIEIAKKRLKNYEIQKKQQLNLF